mmetsp:Transcript_53113/g.124155  ORF Transcript_53113/g.124155 Transcript_53113/m.124155 type:complete len:405 (-) Transcript_53113:1279-2493(-)
MQVFHRRCEGQPHPALRVGQAEIAAWGQRDLGALQQLVREDPAVGMVAADIHPRIEGAIGCDRHRQPQRVQGRHDVVATRLQLGATALELLEGLGLEASQRRALGQRGRADVEVLGQPLDAGQQRRRQHQPAQAPAGHAEVFREAVDRNDVVTQRQRGATEMSVVAERQVDLVDDGDAPTGAHAARDVGQHLRRDGGAGRVAGRCEQHAAGRRRPGLTHLGGAKLEARRGIGGQQARGRVRRRHEMAVAGVARVGHEHLVTPLEEREAGELQRRRGAGRDGDALRGDVEPEALTVPGGNRLTERRQAERVGVGRGPLGHTRDRLPHGGGRAEVRLADVEPDHPAPTLGGVAQRAGRGLCRGLGQLHHVEGLDAVKPGGELHGLINAWRPPRRRAGRRRPGPARH